ncbi:hypothetical protein ACFOEE_14450 [Pseudoalteromonas fenneropenaei]|uniref:Uncharacterized protein n=1 Tax=Pseudoalteromonas fenneropenaei TaxID=1737459 RepID=A0ABV7CMH3_9GAMM
MYGKIIATSVVAALLQSATAHALPDARKGNPLDSMGIPTPAGVGDVIVDHEIATTLYVGPASTKTLRGTYAELGAAGPQCADYVNIKTQAYRQLPTPVLQEQAFLKGDFVSNWYQLTYGIPRSNLTSLGQIEKIGNQLTLDAVANAGLVDQYFELSSLWDGYIMTISELKDELEKLNRKQSDESNSCILLGGGDAMKTYQCMVGVIERYQPLKDAVSAKLTAAENARDAIRDAYYTAKGKYDAYTKKQELLINQISFNTQIVSAQLVISKNAWELEDNLVKAEGTKITGLASAGYSLWGNERNALASVLYQNGKSNYSVKKLDVFNVRLNSGVTRNNFSVETGNSSIFSKNVWAMPADTMISKSITNEWQMPFERENRGDMIYFDTMDANSFATGGVDFYVTKDARCGEYTQEIEELYEGTKDGVEVSWKVVRRMYEPQPNRKVLTANLGLSYNFYAYPGPIKGECTIDVDRMNSYWRNAGKSKSWSWFKSKTRSWDDIRTTARDNMGMECKLDVKPTSNNPAEAQLLAERLETQMYNDMWQMFLAIYAKNYDVQVLDPNVIDPGQSTVGKNIGDGLMKVCPMNVYCQFGNIVLRALDEIGGSKAQGTTSHVSQQYGKIWKRYDKHTWSIQEGSALVTAEVCINNEQCT